MGDVLEATRGVYGLMSAVPNGTLPFGASYPALERPGGRAAGRSAYRAIIRRAWRRWGCQLLILLVPKLYV
jgi:hypothetical protein